MSRTMPDRSCTDLLALLQRHGLTGGVLAAWVALCEQEKTGSFTIHIHEGHMTRYTMRVTEKTSSHQSALPSPS